MAKRAATALFHLVFQRPLKAVPCLPTDAKPTPMRARDVFFRSLSTRAGPGFESPKQFKLTHHPLLQILDIEAEL